MNIYWFTHGYRSKWTFSISQNGFFSERNSVVIWFFLSGIFEEFRWHLRFVIITKAINFFNPINMPIPHYVVKTGHLKRKQKYLQQILLVKSSGVFDFFYLIMKFWELVSLWGVKTHLGFRHFKHLNFVYFSSPQSLWIKNLIIISAVQFWILFMIVSLLCKVKNHTTAINNNQINISRC
jgi:hypothetical protein